jgi:NADH dehydrogenase FAD-containing subunit
LRGLSSTFTVTSSAFGTSPKYDKVKSEFGFVISIVVFGGGWVGVEVDGDIHDLQQKEDARREKVLSKLRLRIVRFRNDEIMKYLSAVVEEIRGLISISK